MTCFDISLAVMAIQTKRWPVPKRVQITKVQLHTYWHEALSIVSVLQDMDPSSLARRQFSRAVTTKKRHLTCPSSCQQQLLPDLVILSCTQPRLSPECAHLKWRNIKKFLHACTSKKYGVILGNGRGGVGCFREKSPNKRQCRRWVALSPTTSIRCSSDQPR